MKKLILFAISCLISISSFAQAAGAPVVDINSGNPKFPFPQFLPYSYGTNHSLGNLGTNNAPGVVHAEMEKLIREAWQIFANEFTYSGQSYGGVQYIKGNNGCPYDCSEGDGYALLAAAYMGDKKIFDGLWMRTHDLRKVKSPRYADCIAPRPTYKYGTNTLAEPGGDAASDGDFDIALALLMAWYQWGDNMGINDACGNPISYKKEAMDVIQGLVEITNSNLGDCRSTSGNIGFDGYVKNGNTWGETTNFSSTRTPECPEFKGAQQMHVDYMAPAYFKAFREFLTAQGVTGWDIDQLLKAEASSDWIVGEWIYKNAKNIPVGGWVDIVGNSPNWSTFMQGEDFRAPWRTILNYVWHGNPTYKWNPTTHVVTQGSPNTYEKDAAVRFSQYLKAPQGAPWNNPCVGFGGGPTLTYKGPATLQWEISPTGAGSSAFTLNWIPGCGAPAAVGAQDYDLMGLLYRQCAIEWDVRTGGDRYLTSIPVYFHGWFRLLGLLVTSGNAHSPTNMLPKANLKVYRAINGGVTYAFTGDNITYKLSYRNYGSVDATNSVIVENVPADFTFVSATNGGVYNTATHTVTWNLGTVKGFKTGQLAQTTGEVSYTVKIKNNASGRYCTTADISCSNGFGSTSNDYPNNVTATTERNCVDVVARALKVEKSFDRDSANKGNMVTCTINFENSADAGWIDGGRPGVRVAFAHDGLANPASAQQLGIKIRLFHDAVEPYINYGNYRISYFMHDPSINCLNGVGCGNGWTLANDIYEGGVASGVVLSHENIVPGSDATGEWNQRLVAQFAPLLVTTTTHLSNYYGLTIRVHQGGTEPLRAKWRMHANYTNLDWSNDWSWDPTYTDADGGNYHPITPDWTDIYNPNKPINSWHPNACQTATKTVNNILVEEFDGYTWRRILGNGPVPGRDITNVIIRDTLPAGMTFSAFTGTNPFGIAPTITTIAGGKQVITWTIPKLQVKQKGKIVYTAAVNFPSGKNCETTDEDIINYAWIQGDNESPVSDTAKIIVTCRILPTVIPPSSLKKTADKSTYSSGDAITYTLEYTQSHGSISTPNLNSTTDWTGSGWTAAAGALTASGGNTSKMTYDYAYGTNGFMEATVTQTEYAAYRVLFREGAATPIAISIKKEWGSQLVISYIQGGTTIQTQTLTYGGAVSPYTLKIHLYNDLLRVWVNNDTTQSPIYSRTGVPIGKGFSGFANGSPADASGAHIIRNLRYHFDEGFNVVITDPIPTEITYGSSSNSGTVAAGVLTWNIPSGKGSSIPFGTKITRTWTGTVNSCNTILENVAYVNIMGHPVNSIAGQVVVNCGASCPPAPTVTTPVNYCKGATATALTATGTALKWYTVATGGTALASAPTPSTATAGTTSYYVSQTANGCESTRALINVVVTETPAPTVTTPVNYCKDATATALTATGTALKWYTVATGGTALASAPTPSTATAGTTAYYVSQTANGCESTRALINVVVTETPAPTVTTPVNYCKGATATALTATGTALKWYTVATGGTALASAPTPSTATAGTTSYYVSQTANGCESTRALINVIVTETAAPTVTTPVNYCKDAPVIALTATGTALKWYTVATGGTGSATAPTPSTATTGTTAYYVSQTANGCESERTLINVVVTETPAPTVTTPANYCVGAPATVLTATGTALKWYTVATGGTALASAPTPNTSLAGTFPYYVSQTVNGCESTRALINVIVTETAAPTVTTPVNYCIGASATALTATGTALKWYTVATGGTALASAPTPSTTTAGTTPYYVSQTANGCESVRALINVVVIETPAPTVTTPVDYCKGATATALTATGTALKWYTVATGGTALASAPTPNTASNGTTPYYVSQTANGCESARALINVVVSEPTVPSVTSPVSYCQDDAATVLTASGTNLAWYTVATGGTALASAPTPPTNVATTINYYVSQKIGSCESARAEIQVIIKPKPTITVQPVSPVCIDASAVTLVATATPIGGSGSFSGTGVSGTTFTPTTAGVGNHIVTYTYTVNACTNTGTTTIAVQAKPTVSFTLPSSACASGTTIPLTGNPAGGTFTASPSISLTGGFNPAIATANQLYTITYSYSDGVCSNSIDNSITVYNPVKPIGTNASQVYTLVPPVPALTATGTNQIWYSDAGLTTQVGTGTSYTPDQTVVTNGVQGIPGVYTYYVVSTEGGCTSTSTPVSLTITSCSAVVPTPVQNSVKMCFGDTNPLHKTLEVTSAGTDIRWYFGGVEQQNGPSKTFIPSQTAVGSYTFEVSQYDNTESCESPRASITFEIVALPSVSFTPPTSVCEGSATINFDTYKSQATGIVTCVEAATTCTQFNPTTAGTYNFVYSYTDVATSCTNTANAQTLVRVLPTVTLQSIPAVCEYDAAFDVSTYANIAGGTFSGTGISGTQFNPALVTPGTSSTITYTYTDGNSCTNSAQTSIQVNARPTVTFNPIPAVCIGSAAIDLTPYATPAGGTYTGTGVTGTTFTPSTAGSFTITYTVTVNGCTNSAQQTITVNPLPIVQVFVSPTLCHNEPSILGVNPISGGILKLDGTPISMLDPSVLLTTTTGIHTVTYEYSDPVTNCYNIATETYTLVKIPQPIVNNKSVELNSTDVSITAIGTGGTLTWKDATSTTVGTGNSINHSSTTTIGAWDYCVTESDGTCTSDPACMTFTVTNCGTPAPTLTNTSYTICSGSTLPSYTTSTPGTIKWYNAVNTLVFTGSTFTPTVSNTVATTHTWTVTSTNGCEGPSTTITLTILPLPVVTITNVATQFCEDSPIETLTTNTDMPGGTFANSGQGVSGNTFNPALVTTKNTAIPINVEYTAPNTCKNNAVILFTVHHLNTLTVPATITQLKDDPETILTATPDAGNSIVWYSACTSSIPLYTGNSFSTGLTGLANTDFVVRQTNIHGCKSDCAPIHVDRIDCPTPAPAIVDPNREICEGDAAPVYTATGTGIMKWYDNTNTVVYTGTTFTPMQTSVGTYNWYVTQTDGCEGIYTPISLIIKARPSVTVTVPSIICKNGSIVTPTVTPSGVSLLLDGNAITTINPTLYTAGNYMLSFTYTDPTTGCSAINNSGYPIEIREIVSPQVANKTTLISAPDLQIAVTNSGSGTLTWKNSTNVTVGTGTSMTHPLAPSVGSWQYCVTETDGTCTSEPACMTYSIINCPVPAPTTLQPNVTACLNEPIPSLQVIGTETIRWYNKLDLATIVYTGASFTPTIATTGTYEYYVVQYDGSCEGAGINIKLTVNSTPQPTVNKSPDRCEGTTTSLWTTTLPGTVHWYMSNPSSASPIATGTTFTLPANTSAGDLSIWTIHENGCKSDPVQTQVTIKPLPQAPTITAQDVCAGSTITYTATSTGTVDWYSSMADIVPIASGLTYTVTNASGTSKTMWATQTVDGCKSAVKSSKTVTINEIPSIPTGNNRNICEYEDIPALIVTNEVGTQFTWYSDEALTTPVSNSYIYTPTSKTTQTLYVTKSKNNCVSPTKTIQFTVNAQPALVQFTPNTDIEICENATISIGANSNMIVRWYDSPTATTHIVQNRYFETPILPIGTHTFYATQTNSNTGCESERASKTVTVIPGPTMPQIVSQSKICQGEAPGTLQVKTTNPLEKITWVSSTGVILQQGETYTPASSYSEQAGKHTFFARNAVAGCPTESSKQVAVTLEVQATPLTPTVSKKEFCYTGDPIELYAKGSNVTWYYIDKSPIAHCMNKETCAPGLITAGEFTFYISQEVLGCVSPMGEVNVVISKPPKPEIIGATHVCSNTTEIYSIKNYEEGNTITWKVTGDRPMYNVANLESAYTRSIDWLAAGIDTVLVTEQNKYGCKGSFKLPVSVTDGPDVDFIVQNPGEEGVIEFTNTSKPQILRSNDSTFVFPVDYFWNYGRITDETVINNEKFFRQQYNWGTHTVTLTAVNEAGCRNSISKEIFVDMSYGLYIPNAFAPLNPAYGVRTFKPRGFNMTNFEISIFDAWGNLVYYSEGVDENGTPLAEWDGTYNGEVAQSGTYIYKIKASFVNGTTWTGSDNNLSNKSTYGNVILIK